MVIAFHRVKKSPLINEIVDRIKFNSQQLFPFSESGCSILSAAGIIYVCYVYFAAIAQVWINLHRQHVFYTVAKEILGRARRSSRDEKGKQGVGDVRFINILQVFSIYFFFSITLLYHIFLIFFFIHDIYPHPRPTTHDPRPKTFSCTLCICFALSALVISFIQKFYFANSKECTFRLNKSWW